MPKYTADDDRIEEVRRHWESEHTDTIHCYLGMRRRITVREFLAYFAEKQPHVDVDSVQINCATAVWDEPATPEELVEREVWRARQRKRTEQWERDTYARLRAKFEPDAAEPTP